MMRLAYAPTSPFVRKVTALAIECGLEDRIQRVANDPWNDSDPLPQVNPLGKVPALQLEDGTLLAGSSLICQYLDSLSPKTKLLPADPRARWQDLALEALADGVLEAERRQRHRGHPPAGAVPLAGLEQPPGGEDHAHARSPGGRGQGGQARWRADAGQAHHRDHLRLSRFPPSRSRLAQGPADARCLVRDDAAAAVAAGDRAEIAHVTRARS